jgi:NitT/TauT family transport system permease protein
MFDRTIAPPAAARPQRSAPDRARTPAPDEVRDRPDDVRPARRGVGERAVDLLERSWRPALFLVLLVVAWWVVSWRQWVARYVVPTPGDTARVFADHTHYLLTNTWVTTYETVVGFVLAVAIGVATAVVMVYSSTVERTLYPIVLFAQVIPKIAIAPLFVVWLGFGATPKIVMAVLISFFPVVISGVAGLRAVDPEMLELASTMRASGVKTFLKIRFPASLPHLFSGIKVAATLAVVGAVVGEFVGANEGLGYVLLQANGNLDAPTLYAGLILMSLIGIVLFAVIEVAERLVMPWHPSRRGAAVTATY